MPEVTAKALLAMIVGIRLLGRGLDKVAAVKQAAALRLRPILMTTAAMVLGVMPLVLASGAGRIT